MYTCILYTDIYMYQKCVHLKFICIFTSGLLSLRLLNLFERVACFLSMIFSTKLNGRKAPQKAAFIWTDKNSDKLLIPNK